jgi:predicted trehalose synthase
MNYQISALSLPLQSQIFELIAKARWFQNKDSLNIFPDFIQEQIKFIDLFEFFDCAFALAQFIQIPGKPIYLVLLKSQNGQYELASKVDKKFESLELICSKDKSEAEIFFKLHELLLSHNNKLQTQNGYIELKFYSPNSELKSKSEPQFKTEEKQLNIICSTNDSTNTAFHLNKKSILKLYRKVEIGSHPEDQILCLLSNVQPKDRLSAIPLSKLIWHLNESTLQDLNEMNAENLGENKKNINEEINCNEIVFGLEQELLDNTGTCWSLLEKRLEELNSLMRSTFVSPPNPLGRGSSDKLSLSAELSDTTALTPACISLIETLDQCFEAIGINLAEMHNQIFELSGKPPFTISDFSSEDLQEIETEIFELFNSLKTQSSESTYRFNILTKGKLDSFIKTEKEKLNGSSGIKLKIHGDFHLGQILRTRIGYKIIDFEGQPINSLAERWKLKSPLKDLAGALRSIQYARDLNAKKRDIEKQNSANTELNDFWDKTFLHFEFRLIEGYTYKAEFPLPDAITPLLNLEILLKTFQELDYELKTRPEMASICLKALEEQIG